MDKLWVVLLAGAPCWSFLLWVAGWLLRDALHERRRMRAAARVAQRGRAGQRQEQDNRGQASAA